MASGSRYSIVLCVVLIMSVLAPCLATSAAPSPANGVTSKTTYASPDFGDEVDSTGRKGQSAQVAEPLDLAAMPLTPADLETLGFKDYQFSDLGGQTQSVDVVATELARFHDIDEQEARADLDEAGWQREYRRTALLLADPSDAGSGIITEVVTDVTEYGDAEGAAAGFALFEDEPASQRDGQYEFGNEDIPGTRTFGDESEITIATSTSNGTKSYLSIELTFRVDNLVAAVKMNEDTVDGRARRPGIDHIETLGGRLLERVDEVQGARDPLGLLPVRLTALDEVDFTVYNDEYWRYQGETFRLKGESEADLADRARNQAADGIVDGYGYVTALQDADASAFDDPYAYSIDDLRRFNNEDLAAAFVDGARARLQEDNPSTRFEIVDAEQFGEQSVMVAAPRELADGTSVTQYLVYARTGAVVARLSIQPETMDIPRAAVETLAAEQVDCLEAGACREPMDASLLLNGNEPALGRNPGNRPTSTDEANNAAQNEPAGNLGRVNQGDAAPSTADAPGVNGDTYESPSYGYTFTWDRSWQMVNATSADGKDSLQLERDGGELYIEGYPFDGDAVACAQTTSQAYQDDAAYSDYGPLQDGAGNEIGGSDAFYADLAFSATYTAADGTTTPVAIYIGCWQAHVGPNAVVRFTLVTTPDVFSDAYNSLQEVLGTLRI